MFELRVYPSAEADLDEAVSFILRDSLEHAIRLQDAVFGTYKRIRDHPLQWPRCEYAPAMLGNVRRCNVQDFPTYVVYYRVAAHVIEILRVLHGARDVHGELAATPYPPA